MRQISANNVNVMQDRTVTPASPALVLYSWKLCRDSPDGSGSGLVSRGGRAWTLLRCSPRRIAPRSALSCNFSAAMLFSRGTVDVGRLCLIMFNVCTRHHCCWSYPCSCSPWCLWVSTRLSKQCIGQNGHRLYEQSKSRLRLRPRFDPVNMLRVRAQARWFGERFLVTTISSMNRRAAQLR